METIRLKSYFTPNVESALTMARQELGPEAMLMHSRKAPPEAAHLGQYEVVFASPQDPLPAVAGSEPAPTGTREIVRLTAELAGLRKQLERMAVAMARSEVSVPGPMPEIFKEALSILLASEMEPGLAMEVVSGAQEAAPANWSELRRAVTAELERRIRIESALGCSADGPRIIALVGPCGVGKTTTLVKLAMLGLKSRRPVHILTMDNYRFAAADQLQRYAGVLGVGFQALETVRALAQALEEHQHKDLILIDTPGFGPADLDSAAGLSRFLSSNPAIDTHLVLTATMKSADLSRAADRFEIFRPGKLLFTRMDETDTFGPLVSEAVRTGKAISYLAGGQQIPEDLEPATVGVLADLLWKGQVCQAAAAA